MPLGPSAVPCLAASTFGWEGAYLLVGGTALFLLGVGMASDGLRRAAGGKMRALFTMVSRNRLAGLGAGFTITAMLQSSSASTVVLVGLADAGLLTAAQSAAMILGAGVGTTLVPQILAFKVAEWGLLFVAAGLAVRMISRWQVWKNVGWALAGFGLLFYGMHVMGQATEPIGADPAAAARLARLAGNPWLAFAAAALLTGVIQSSGATVALAMTLAAQGALAAEAALPVVVGANVGTCITAMIAAVGAGREGRKVALTHLGFKLLAAGLVLPFAGRLGGLMAELSGWLGAGPERAVANAHTAFNVAMAAAFLPFCDRLALLFGRLVPRRASRAEKLTSRLSRALSGEPSAALLVAGRALAEMGSRCCGMLRGALEGLERGGARRLEEVGLRDDEVDAMFIAMSSYLAHLTGEGLRPGQAARLNRTLYLARLFEEVGDLVSRDLVRLGQKRAKLDAEFSMEGAAALRRFGAAAAAELEKVSAAVDREEAGGLAGLAAGAGRIEDEYRRLLAEHFEQVGRGVAGAGQTGSIYPDALAALRDVRRTVAEMARVISAGAGDGREAG